MKPALRRGLLPLLGVLFVVTGGTALVIEQALEKILTTIVGASTVAGSLVLSTYFVGLALGGLAYPRLRRFVPRPIALYATLEGAVGVYAALAAAVLAPLSAVSCRLVHLAGDGAGGVLVARVVVTAAWVLPPTVCMGASFPAVVGALRGASHASLVPRFYALNLLGALLGSIVAPYVLFARLGLGGGLVAAAVAQVLVVGAALFLDRSRGGEAAPLERAAPVGFGGATGAMLLATAFASGAIVFACEVMWLHLMGVTLGMSVYTFANMLAIVLGGLFLGGVASSLAFAGRDALPSVAMPIVLSLAALVLAMTTRGWPDVPIRILDHASFVRGFAGGELVRARLAAEIAGPASVALGLVYPMLFRMPGFPPSADRAAAVLGALNAAGSLVGALLAAFALIPSLGAERALPLLTFALLLLAAAWVAVRRERGVAGLAVAAAIAGGALYSAASAPPWDRLALTAGTNVYFRRSFTRPSSRLAFFHEDAEGGITTVVANETSVGTVRTLLTNGKFQGDDGGEAVDQTAFALLPCVMTPGRERALVIGLGTGHTASVVRAAGFREVEIVDISRGVVAAAHAVFGDLNRGVLDLPGVSVFHEDGRNHLLRSGRTYDVIGMELTSVWFAGAGNLYSRELYELARDRLAPGGVVQQWIQLHHIAPDEVISAIATVRGVFEHVTLWSLQEQGVLLASRAPHTVREDVVASLRATPALARDLDRLERSGKGLDALDAHRLLDDAATTRLFERARARGVPENTDARRYLEYATPRHNLETDDRIADNRAALRAAGAP